MCRRGLTLVEVLASTVLLALIAAACTPLLRQATRLMCDPGHSFELFELSRLADALISDPTAFGLESVHGQSNFEVAWSDQPDRSAVAVRLLTADTEDVDHAWLTFACDGWVVSRWVPLEARDDQGAAR